MKNDRTHDRVSYNLRTTDPSGREGLQFSRKYESTAAAFEYLSRRVGSRLVASVAPAIGNDLDAQLIKYLRPSLFRRTYSPLVSARDLIGALNARTYASNAARNRAKRRIKSGDISCLRVCDQTCNYWLNLRGRGE